jgi:hypothetical protein
MPAARPNHSSTPPPPKTHPQVYYNASNAAQEVTLYNRLYTAFWGGPSTIDQIMQREAVRVVREGLLKLRKDPHMMVRPARACVARIAYACLRAF